MRTLVTGSLGFVGRYLRTELEENGYEVTGLDILSNEKTILADLLNFEEILSVMQNIRPDVVIHLAGQANVAQSWKTPAKTMEANVIAAINLLEAVRQTVPQAKVVLVGSSDEYGVLGDRGIDVTEDIVLHPQTPYAVSKMAQENMAQIYVKAYGMNVCMTRSFNHGGAGQREGFMIPDFSAGIVRVEKGQATCLRVGNLNSRRDFTHVKDIVRAYRLIAEKGHSGEVYNVGSGRTYSAREILDALCQKSTCSIPIESDPDKMRPSDTPVICCNHDKLTSHTGWAPQYTIQDILTDTLTYYRELL